MKLSHLLEGRGGGKQKAAAKLNAYIKSRAEIDKHFADHDWPKSLHGTPQEIMRVGHDVHLAPGGGEVGKIKSIDGRKITIAFKNGDETVDVLKVYPSFLSKP